MRAAPSILLASVTTLLLGCSDSTGPSPSSSLRSPASPDGASFQVAPSTATLQEGQSFWFTTTYAGNPALSGGSGGAAWHSSNESVATVSQSGLVRGISGGQARIVAIRGSEQASALVTVTGPRKKQPDPIVCVKRLPSAGQLRSPQC
jgi:hypothetical protein